MRVLRVSHSAVVSAWRERERELRRRGAQVRLLSAEVWNEGGSDVALRAEDEDWVQGVSTFGTHPNLFVFAPGPLWRALRSTRWDVIDLHEEPCSLAVAEILLLRRLARVAAPVVLYSAQNIDKRYPPPFRWFERAALHTAAGVSVCNHEAGRILRRKGLRGEVAEIPLGVDLTLFAPADRLPPGPTGPFTVGYVGRLEHRKGVGVAIDAVAGDPALRLVLVGSGPDDSALRRQAEAAGCTDRVQFLGPMSSGELADTYRRFDVLVVPSLPTPGWLEQFGRVVVEAMASGVPVIASRSGALPDVVGAAGILVEPDDSQALAAAISEVVRDGPRWDELREAGLRHAQAFTWSAVADGMGALYADVTADVTAADAVAGPTVREVPPRTNRPLEIVVIAYGTPDKLTRALTPLTGMSITIVDNSASAETAAIAERVGARYLDPGANLGFGAGVNYALARLAEPQADVLLLNPDAGIDPAAIGRLHDELRAADDIAAVAPGQVDDQGDEAVVHWPFPSPRQAMLEAAGLGRLRRRGEFLIGSILLLRREALDEVGGFDERFFLYAEETDWQKRAHDAGWELRLVGSVRGRHEGAGADVDPGWRETQFTASLELYILKHYGSRGWWLFRGAGLTGAMVRALVLRGPAAAAARRRVRLYLHGPVRLNSVARPPGSAPTPDPNPTPDRPSVEGH